MGIRGNFSRLTFGLGKYAGGGAAAMSPGNLNRPEEWMAKTMRSGESTAKRTMAHPTGYYPQGAWRLPMVAGEMSAGVAGSGELTAGIAGGLNAQASLSGQGDLTGAAALIVSMAASLSGDGGISSADLQGVLNLAAALSGSGGVTAQATALGELAVALSGSGGLTAQASALGEMAASITVTGTGLSTANVADAILDASNGVENDLTLRQALRLITAALAGKISGAATTTITIRNTSDDKSRIVATVDADGNRTALTYDLDD